MITLKLIADKTVDYFNGDATFTVFGDATGSGISLQSTPEPLPSVQTITWPGEYDFSGVAVTGIGHNSGESVSYLLTYDNIKTAFLVDPLHDWSSKDIEHLGGVDVLVLPAAEGKLVQKIIDEIEPRIVVIIPGSNPELLQDSLKAVGAIGKEAVAEYKIKSLPAEGREVVVFG